MFNKLTFVILPAMILSPTRPAQQECTVGVAIGKGTVDGRPLPSSISQGNPNQMNALIQQVEDYVYADANQPGWLFTKKLQSAGGTGILPDHLTFERNIFTDADRFLIQRQKQFPPEKIAEEERQTDEKIVRQLQKEVKYLR